jgi:hypothetical protein
MKNRWFDIKKFFIDDMSFFIVYFFIISPCLLINTHLFFNLTRALPSINTSKTSENFNGITNSPSLFIKPHFHPTLTAAKPSEKAWV